MLHTTTKNRHLYLGFTLNGQKEKRMVYPDMIINWFLCEKNK